MYIFLSKNILNLQGVPKKRPHVLNHYTSCYLYNHYDKKYGEFQKIQEILFFMGTEIFWFGPPGAEKMRFKVFNSSWKKLTKLLSFYQVTKYGHQY